MFFNSIDRDASLFPVRSSRQFRKGAAAIALAAAAAVPVVCLAPSAPAMTEIDQAMVLLAEQAQPTDPQLLAAGIEQYSKGQYEEAQATLQQVKPEGLSQNDKERLNEAMTKVEAALAQRKAARAEFELGEQALAEKNLTEAQRHYRAAADNRFADEATRSKAIAQMQVAEASQKAARNELKGLYREAVQDEKAGRLTEAREKFVKLRDAGYRVGLFEKKPADFVNDIDEKLAKAQRDQEREAQAAAKKAEEEAEKARQAQARQTQTPEKTQETTQPQTSQQTTQEPTPAPEAKRSGKQAYEAGVAAYRAGNYTEARALFQEAQAANYKPGLFRDSPARYLSMIDARERKAQQVEPQPEPQPRTQTDVAVAPATQPALSPAERELQESARLEKARQQQRAYEAQQLVERARTAQQDNRLADAFALYSEAAALDPNNRAAVEGKAQMQLMVTGAPERPLMERETDRARILREIVTYSFDRAIADANAAIAAGNFTAAQEALDAAAVAKESRPELFNREELQRFDTTLANARLSLAQARESATAASQRTAAQQAAIEAEQRRQLELEERRRTVESLARTARQLVYDGQYQQALGVINHILAIDPTNDYAVGVKQLVQDSAILQEQRRIRERISQEVQKQLNAAEEAKTPYMDILRYPTNWPDISETRDRTVAEEKGQSVEDVDQEARLDTRLPQFNFEQAPLAEVFKWMGDVTGANIVPAWNTMEAAGIKRDTQISLSLNGVKCSRALQAILNDVGGGKLGYAIEGGMVTISTADDLNRNMTTEVYDIRDLLVVAPDFADPPNFMIEGSEKRKNDRHDQGTWGATGQLGTYSTGSYGNGTYNAAKPNTTTNSPVTMTGSGQVAPQKTQELVEAYTNIIKSSVDPNSWIDNGGKFGSLKYLSGNLIVTQSADNQRRVASLLDKLRETRAIQVSIEARFLTVSRNFLEDIGVDIDFFFNITDPNRFSPIQVSQASAGFTQNPQTPVPGTISSGGNLQPAMQIQGSFLDDFQANFLIRATQAARHTTVVTAPRVTVFNGQPAFVVVAQQTAYVADLEAVTGEGVGLFNPVVDTVQSGVRLVVQPTVSADRKYVTLALQPQVSQLVSLLPFPVFGVANQTGTGTGTGGGTTPGQPNIFTANLQLPIINITAINTIVSVPDGGTLLIGGQTVAGESENEEGVPILSKIPFVKRLFSNRSTAKDENILLILVKPVIIIHREIEQQQFPLLKSTSRP